MALLLVASLLLVAVHLVTSTDALVTSSDSATVCETALLFGSTGPPEMPLPVLPEAVACTGVQFKGNLVRLEVKSVYS